MRNARECPVCGASLDYGERCECERYWDAAFAGAAGAAANSIKKEQSRSDRPFKIVRPIKHTNQITLQTLYPLER